MDIRENLREIIEDKGYRQKAIADKANMSPSKLSQILRLERRLDANEMFDICKAIEITPMELADYKKARSDKVS